MNHIETFETVKSKGNTLELLLQGYESYHETGYEVSLIDQEVSQYSIWYTKRRFVVTEK